MGETSIRTYEETYKLPLKAYEAVDQDGQKVTINTKTPANHQSESTYDQWAPVFLNLGWILQNYDEVRLDTSNNPVALKNKELGTVKIYTKKDFLKTLDLEHLQAHDRTEIVVLYKDDKTENYSLTYSIYPDPK